MAFTANNRRQPLTEHRGSQRAVPATVEVHKVPGLSRSLCIKKQKNPLSEHGSAQRAATATNSTRRGSPSAGPGTKSRRQETKKYFNYNKGTDRRPPQIVTDNTTPKRLLQFLHVKKEIHTLITMERRIDDQPKQPPRTQQPEPIIQDRNSENATPTTNSIYRNS